VIQVTTAEFIKNYGTLADKALREPITITKNGKDRLVLMSVELYQRLKDGQSREAKVEQESA
jgi:PHD/YefM family antitoxin component YafN of YafNO toxin-antitoxin module